MVSLSGQTKKIQAFIKAHLQITTLKEKAVADFYLDLIDCIVDHNHLYYVENKPLISDKEYDELFDYLKKIEDNHPQLISSNSPTQSLIGQVSEGFQQASHKVKLLSLENSYNAEDLKSFDERLKKILEKQGTPQQVAERVTDYSYEIEPKYDGISVELVYEDGKLLKAVTRGDGVVGDDVTVNAKTIKSIPKKLNGEWGMGNGEKLSVRGEIMMPKSVWKRLNKEREEVGLMPFANPRNATAGSVKLLDSHEVAKRGLVFFVYDLLYPAPPSGDIFAWFEKLGFSVLGRNPHAKSIDEVVKICLDPKTKEHLESFDYDFDGLVIKIVGEQNRQILGATEHHPRWAIAYKFPAQLAATQVNSVDFQVGRTGIITPVANLEAVDLSGVRIKRVSLHNFDFISSKDIHLHDRIWLQRSGEVIPYIVSVITERRGSDAKRIIPPSKCPSCHQKVLHEDIHYYCVNSSCPAQIKEKIIHFVSKNCMDIEGIGESTVDLLVEHHILKDVSDLYKLPDPKVQFQINKFPGFADKKISEICSQIVGSQKRPLWRLLNGLGIDGVGKKTAQELVKAVNSKKLRVHNLDGLVKVMTDQEFLISIYGVGEQIVQNIVKFFSVSGPRTSHKVLLKKLEESGLNFDAQKYNEDMLDEESSKGSFSITGTFPVSRDQIVQIMQKNGYLFHDHPTQKTDFMLIGDAAGSKKLKAQELGIQIYEGWDTVIKIFPYLKNISVVSKKASAQSLF